ncbi:hypothetical protein JYU34_003778 [Plutella xylostella]|uniref:Cation/H+ exchanger transmembrane domain-containing protein n=1 Tax=Plutella xylostella TaxID=51655 RepID=A0ABQ7R0W8_PLUXY|nr:hypothetical protein JYU34_003778 [Plutella xylostella]
MMISLAPVPQVTSLLGRAVNIYPLSFLLNLGRKPPIPMNFQHMLFFSGLRGAMSFALAIRNTVSEARQAMLTSTSLIVILTVILQGGAASHALAYLRIPTGESQNDETDALPYRDVRSETPGDAHTSSEKARLARVWGALDSRLLKPLLTHARPPLTDTLPSCMRPLAQLLTTTHQYTMPDSSRHRTDSDSDLCIDEQSPAPSTIDPQLSINIRNGYGHV